VISTASEPFDMVEIDNQFAHITTEAVQIKSKKFGEYEPGNKVDFHAFQNYLDAAFGEKYNFAEQAFPRMQEAVAHFARANCPRLAHSRRGGSF
jgi:tubulin polyglutamylase TTLL1/tubulin monoglycylase TTLL3/8